MKFSPEVHPCNDGLLLVSETEVVGRVDNTNSIPAKDRGLARVGGIETTILYFDPPTFNKLKEWYHADNV